MIGFSFRIMQRDFTPEERLNILRAGDKLRTWSSLDDERLCILCERILNGWQIEILRDQRGRYLLKCPTSDCETPRAKLSSRSSRCPSATSTSLTRMVFRGSV